MNRDRMLLGLGAALIVAFIASSYVYRQIQRAQTGGAGKTAKQAQVVVAAGPAEFGPAVDRRRLGVDGLAGRKATARVVFPY